MTRIALFLILSVILFSCDKREVQLAESHLTEITRVYDVSPIYIFYNEETASAEFNRNNMIGTTNWLVNIDKRLSMEQVYPHLQFLYKKRTGDGMHKNEQARNFFTCSNPDIQNLTFIDFTGSVYHDVSISEYILNTEPDSTETQVIVTFEKHDLVQIEKGITTYQAKRASWIDSLSNSIETEEAINRVYMNIDAEMSFQDYIQIRSGIDTLAHDKVRISDHEFIYK